VDFNTYLSPPQRPVFTYRSLCGGERNTYPNCRMQAMEKLIKGTKFTP